MSTLYYSGPNNTNRHSLEVTSEAIAQTISTLINIVTNYTKQPFCVHAVKFNYLTLRTYPE